MPITKEDNYVFKAKNDQGAWRIAGGIWHGDYGPRLNIIKTPFLMKILEGLEDGQRAYFPLWNQDKDKIKNTVEETSETNGEV